MIVIAITERLALFLRTNREVVLHFTIYFAVF